MGALLDCRSLPCVKPAVATPCVQVVDIPGPAGPQGPAGPPGGVGNGISYYTGAAPTSPPANPALPALALKQDGTGTQFVWNITTQTWN